jgi:hypothetical protein
MTELAFLVNVATGFALFGLIWTIQVDVYPLFGCTGERAFAEFHRQHSNRITLVVAPLMLAELASSIALVVAPPEWAPAWAFWAGLGLVLAAWGSTAFIQVPAHGALGAGFDAAVHRRLVATNWIRTAAWTGRAAILLWLLALRL